jgi:hypothetical protein
LEEGEKLNEQKQKGVLRQSSWQMRREVLKRGNELSFNGAYTYMVRTYLVLFLFSFSFYFHFYLFSHHYPSLIYITFCLAVLGQVDVNEAQLVEYFAQGARKRQP